MLIALFHLLLSKTLDDPFFLLLLSYSLYKFNTFCGWLAISILSNVLCFLFLKIRNILFFWEPSTLSATYSLAGFFTINIFKDLWRVLLKRIIKAHWRRIFVIWNLILLIKSVGLWALFWIKCGICLIKWFIICLFGTLV